MKRQIQNRIVSDIRDFYLMILDTKNSKPKYEHYNFITVSYNALIIYIRLKYKWFWCLVLPWFKQGF
jgi:hypothetical protein